MHYSSSSDTFTYIVTCFHMGYMYIYTHAYLYTHAGVCVYICISEAFLVCSPALIKYAIACY